MVRKTSSFINSLLRIELEVLSFWTQLIERKKEKRRWSKRVVTNTSSFLSKVWRKGSRVRLVPVKIKHRRTWAQHGVFPLIIDLVFDQVSSVSFLSGWSRRHSFYCASNNGFPLVHAGLSPSLASCYTILQQQCKTELTCGNLESSISQQAGSASTDSRVCRYQELVHGTDGESSITCRRQTILREVDWESTENYWRRNRRKQLDQMFFCEGNRSRTTLKCSKCTECSFRTSQSCKTWVLRTTSTSSELGQRLRIMTTVILMKIMTVWQRQNVVVWFLHCNTGRALNGKFMSQRIKGWK